jgi:hypothetical protein
MIWFKLWRDSRKHLLAGLAIVLLAALVEGVVAPSGLTIFGLDPARFPHLPLVSSTLPDPRAPGFASSAWWLLYLNVAVLIAPMIGIITAGSGISTHTPDGMRRTHPSVIYTLSLPVARSRWMVAQAAFGFLQMAVLILLLAIVPAALAPVTGGHFSWASALASFPFMLAGAAVFHALAMFLATFLEEYWQAVLSVVALMSLALLVSSGQLREANLFRFMSGFSQSWAGAIACVALTAIFFASAIRVVERQEL